MSKKKGNNNENDQKKNNKEGGGGKKKENGGGDVVVLKMDLHCKGCAAKVVKCVKYFDGVVSVKGGDSGDMNKLTVAGKVDPAKLRERLEKKTKKKVEILSPLPKKEKEKEKEKEDSKKETKGNAKNKECNEAEEKNKKKNKSIDNKPVKQTDDKNKKNNKVEVKNVKKSDEKKSNEPPVTTILLKVNWHCQGCIRKIERVVTKTKGYVEMSIDRQKNLLTVKGSMDPKLLAESLKKRLKKSVEIVQAKKEGGGGEKGKGGKGGGGGDGESKADEGGSGGKGSDNTGGRDGGSKGHKMEYVQFEYPYSLVYGSGYLVEYVHAPQLFSDENPNACVVM